MEENKEKIVDKPTKKTRKKKTIPENNRFTDVIEKMEEESKKIEKEKKIEEPKNNVEEKKEKISKNKEEKTIKKQSISRAIKKTQIETELETIEKEIENNNTTFKEEISKCYKNIFANIMYANIIVIYFILLITGYKSIGTNIFLTGIKVFSIILIIATICIFEKAYKNDSGKYAINAIELMFLAITTLLSLKIYMHYNNKFVSAITSIALLFAIYYVGKSIVIYMKQKREAKKYKNDIRKIAKK